MTDASTSPQHALPTPQALERLAIAAVRAVSQASIVCRYVQARLGASSRIDKPDSSPVTIADFAAQAVINSLLPRDIDLGIGPAAPMTMVGEESASMLIAERLAGIAPDGGLSGAIAQALAESGVMSLPAREELIALIDHAKPLRPLGPSDLLPETFWTADPIDGTRGFLKGRQYAVCLALIHRGQPVIGVLACPNLGQRVVADEAGSPAVDSNSSGTLLASWSGAPVYFAHGHASEVLAPVAQRLRSEGQAIRLTQGMDSGDEKLAKYERLVGRLNATARSTGMSVGKAWRLDSQAKYAMVATGEADVYLRFPYRSRAGNENIWDHASGVFLCQQAGCRATDLDGRELNFAGYALATNRGVLVAPPPVHAVILDAISALAM